VNLMADEKDAPQKTTAHPAAPRKRTGGHKGGSRKGRDQWTVEDTTDKVEYLMLLGIGAQGIHAGLKKEAQEKGQKPMPIRTVEDYIRRVKERWRKEKTNRHLDARDEQIKRLSKYLVELRATPHIAPARHADILATERLLADLHGNLAPIKIETPDRHSSEELTKEQVDFILEHGYPPPGVNLEKLRGK
jgi:hypothetical protein